MDRQKISRGALLTSNLPQLQNLIKRDPAGYREEFLQQWNHYDSILHIFQAKPDDPQGADRFKELVTFISQVAQCYPKETKEFPSQIASLLLENYPTLNPDTRKTLVHNLVLLRNKDVITSIELLKTLFPILPRTTSSALRSFIRQVILTDIKTANLRTKNHKLNRAVQAMLFGMVERGMDGEVLGDKGKLRGQQGVGESAGKGTGDEAMWAIVLSKELWKKGIWTDPKTVSIVSLGCFHPITKVQSASVHFFLGSENEDEESDDEDGRVDVKGAQHKRAVGKKTKSGEARYERTLKSAKKRRHERDRKARTSPNFPALQLLNDPQTFAEKLYDSLSKYDKRFSLDHKILLMQLLSRVMGAHQLCVLNFYPYITKYLTYHQLRVTSILVSLAQSVHQLTPPDILTPVIRKLAHEFVHPGVGTEVVAAGLNAIREVCRRQPWCMEEDLLGDLIEYRKSRDKGVIVAARSLLQLYRDVNPGMLKKRERGKAATMGVASGTSSAVPFGHTPPAAGIEGLELLEEHFERLREEETALRGPNADPIYPDEDDDAGWEGWEVESDSDSDSEEGWISVSSDEDEQDIVVSDSSDEEGAKAKKKALKKSKAKKLKTLDGDGDDDDEMGDMEKEQDDEMALTADVEALAAPEAAKVSTLATQKILTPADFALLAELRLKAAKEQVEQSGNVGASKRKLAQLESARKANNSFSSSDPATQFLSEGDLLGPRKRVKQDHQERMASIQKGREGREKFGSNKGKKKKDIPSSSTNREKLRNKPIMMILGSNSVKSKKKVSLREKQRKLRAHIDGAKKAYK